MNSIFFFIVGWSISPDERDWKYRLSIYYIKPQDTGIYTCATPKGKTHSIVLNVIAVHCDATKVISTDPNLLTQVQGSRLGQQTLFSCREGFKLNGTANMTCQASGKLCEMYDREQLNEIYLKTSKFQADNIRCDVEISGVWNSELKYS